MSAHFLASPPRRHPRVAAQLLLGTAVALAALNGLAARSASATCMDCKRTASGFNYDNPIPVYLAINTFCGTHTCNGAPQGFCYPATNVENALQRALEQWNRSGANIRFRYVGQTNVTDPCFLGSCDWLIVRMEVACNSGAWGSAYLCGNTVYLNPRFNFSTSVVVPVGFIDMTGVLVHELGHILGFKHTCDCGSSNNSVMYTPACPGSNDQGLTEWDTLRHLWQQDYRGVRHGSHGYGEKLNTRVRLRYSTNGFASHYTLTDPEDYSSHRPAVTYGEVFSGLYGTPYYVEAHAGAGYGGGYDLLYTRRGDGAAPWSNSNYTGGWTNHGVALASAPGTSPLAPTVFLLVHVSHGDDRQLYWQTSTNGLNWTSPQVVSGARATSPPGLSWNAGVQRFVLVRSERNSNSRICFKTASLCGSTLCNWSGDYCPDPQGDYLAVGAPAIVCDPTGSWPQSGYCRLSYRDGADLSTAARVRVREVFINGSGAVSITGTLFVDRGNWARSTGVASTVLWRTSGATDYLQVHAKWAGASGFQTAYDSGPVSVGGGTFATQYNVVPWL